MTKEEYLQALHKELQALPYEEQNEALSYYRSYFEDAGDDNTAAVIEELGTPEKLGSYIRSNFSCVPETNFRTGKKEPRTETKRTMPDKDKSGINMLLLILLLTLTFPLWGSIVLGLIGAAFGIIAAIIAVVFAGLAAAVALFISGIVAAAAGISVLFISPFTALLGTGIGLFLLGAALIGIIVSVWICKKVFPPLMRGIVKVCSLPFKRRKSKA